MTKLYFLRHGETDWNVAGRSQGRTDIHLNENGENQAKACIRFFEDKALDVIITSPLMRAKKTAEIVKANLDIPLIEMEEFIEIGFGDAEGLSKEEQKERFKDNVIPNRETNELIEERFIKAIDYIKENYKDKNILVVSHGAILNTLLHFYTNGEVGTGKTKLLNTSITTVELEEDTFKVLKCNDIEHLS